MNIAQIISQEIGAKSQQIEAAIALLDEGATVPFIARYRKEATQGLDDTQLRKLDERLLYLRELQDRKHSILDAIDSQGKLTPELKKAIEDTDSKTRLEDLYAPYKTKRRTKAQIAREAGIEPLLDSLMSDASQSPEQLAETYLNTDAGFDSSDKVLAGAQAIFMERAGEQADLVGELRELAWQDGIVSASVVKAKEKQAQKFQDYFDYQEAYKKIPSHRALAIFRGRAEGFLRLKMQIPGQDDLESKTAMGQCDQRIANFFKLGTLQGAAKDWLNECVRNAWRIKLSIQIETELNARLRELADNEAIRVFGSNLRDLLLAAPAGGRAMLGLDPGLRTGVKAVAIDKTGKLLAQTTIFPHAPKNQWDQSIDTLAKLIKQYQLELVSIGNGTASRETDKLVNELKQKHKDLNLTSVMVSEAGASVYSASELAAKEFPDLDVSYRGAVSIARRLQDPLAELVKIEPKAIGVGQYQHDVNQNQLTRQLNAVVEDCVNAVGVELNTASAPLLTRIAGLNDTIANNIIDYREQHGAFRSREQLLNVPRLGPKAYEQAAGFLRIVNGDNPLDASAVHPEAYALVNQILADTDKALAQIIGDSSFLKKLNPKNYVTEQFGEPTVRDILQELDKPGRDPRPEFKTAAFKDGVETLSDLKPGMLLEGVISNVTNFGAFVDIGVHQDGLVHISVLADHFVKDPHAVVKTGQVVKVKVLEVDVARSRIALTMRLQDSAHAKSDGAKAKQHARPRKSAKPGNASKQPKSASHNQSKKPINSAMADAFAKLNKS